MKILFLDIDGVLNHSHGVTKGGMLWIDPEHVKHLNSIVEQSGCRIVLSSVWRTIYKLSIVGLFLEECGFKYKSELIDKTTVLPQEIRGKEIEKWLQRYGRVVDQYVIIDDDSDMTKEQKPNFVQTSFKTGLTKELADKAIQILNKNTNANS